MVDEYLGLKHFGLKVFQPDYDDGVSNNYNHFLYTCNLYSIFHITLFTI